MIIRPAANHLHFITQSDHARLSREVMEACPALLANPRRSEVLHAIGEHDNGWAEPDAAPIVDPATGTPLDFGRACGRAACSVSPVAPGPRRSSPSTQSRYTNGTAPTRPGPHSLPRWQSAATKWCAPATNGPRISGATTASCVSAT